MINEKLRRLNGLRHQDFQPTDRVGDVETALVEVADMAADSQISLADLEDAIVELAEIIAGGK